jgi:hypothetical protein
MGSYVLAWCLENLKYLFHVKQPFSNLPVLAHATEAAMGVLLVFNTFWSNNNGYAKLLYFLHLSWS